MNIKERIEREGKAPKLGWVDCRRRGHPINLRKTDVLQTIRAIQKIMNDERKTNG